mmetsp:Transcript_38427/g.92974  ORF Transcript_38427/g.92974 Transcript_38427/m.92974 type:complete len:201 (+) Transcript_38427:593-1195(+)
MGVRPSPSATIAAATGISSPPPPTRNSGSFFAGACSILKWLIDVTAVSWRSSGFTKYPLAFAVASLGKSSLSMSGAWLPLYSVFFLTLIVPSSCGLTSTVTLSTFFLFFRKKKMNKKHRPKRTAAAPTIPYNTELSSSSSTKDAPLRSSAVSVGPEDGTEDGTAESSPDGSVPAERSTDGLVDGSIEGPIDGSGVSPTTG